MDLFVDIKKKLPGFTLNVKLDADNDATALLGASGSGKSMTLRCIAGLETPDSGQIALNGKFLYNSAKKINLSSRKRRIGFLFQNYALFPHMTVEQNIGFGLKGCTKNEQSRRVREMIGMIRLEGLEKRYIYHLSGGQQQRVALARALAVEPEALLLDEPFSALDEYLRNQMVKQLIETLSIYKGATVFVTHNMEEAYRICSKILVLSEGKRTAYGSRSDIFSRPPNLAAARLTGCKNISRVRKLSQNTVEASEWGCCKLTVKNDCPDITHLGIRAHYISLAKESDETNVLECRPAFTNESPFKMTVYLIVGEQPLNDGNYHLQWEMEKESWYKLKEKPLPWKICLSPEKLILINEDDNP